LACHDVSAGEATKADDEVFRHNGKGGTINTSGFLQVSAGLLGATLGQRRPALPDRQRDHQRPGRQIRRTIAGYCASQQLWRQTSVRNMKIKS
jgi:hypothetical protein